MIEVLFGESEAASMKAAKNKVIIGKVSGPTSVWMAGKKTPPATPFSGWVEGTPEEVICLGFLMDVGDIRQPMDGSYRKKLIYSLYAQNQWEQDPETEKELRDAAGFYAKEWQRLMEYLDQGESIRIWYSDAPYSLCGLYSLCRSMIKRENRISVVRLPEHIQRGNEIIRYQSWNDVPAEEFAGFLPFEKPLSREEIRMYAAMWSELEEENSPLRAVVNGKILSVPENFYDFLIWERLGQAPVKEARLIGDILGHFQLGVSDWWYAKRIDFYIRQGRICVVEDSEYKYARILAAV